MRMKKSMIIDCVAAMLFLVLSQRNSWLYVADFEGNEEAQLNKCSVAQENEAAAQQCAVFKEYYAGLNNSLGGEISSLDKEISAIKNDIEEIISATKQLQSLIDKLDKDIEINEVGIRTIEGQISKSNVKVKKKQKGTSQRNEIITNRMLDEQAVTSTNVDVEVTMGSKDFADMIREVDGLQGVTNSDQMGTKKLQKDKAELGHQKSEKNRLKTDVEVKKTENRGGKRETEKVQKQKKRLLGEYRKQEAELSKKMRSVWMNVASIRSNVVSISTSVVEKLDFSGSGVFMMPIHGGNVSTGTWYYPDGGVRLGLDITAPIGTSLVTPADGIVLYVNNPAPANGGFLNSQTGYPAGDGNTIQVSTQTNRTTYTISFFHLSREDFAVSKGSRVEKRQLLALTGHSGSSIGPHCHIETINLGKMSISSVISQFRSSADFAWDCDWGNGALSRTCGVNGAPCREGPESTLG